MSIGSFSKIYISDTIQTSPVFSVNAKNNNNVSRKKNKSTKELKYPVLLDCCEYTSDEVWLKLFKKAAYGNPPKGFKFANNNSLYYVKHKKMKDKKPIMIKIDQDDPKTTFHEFTDFVQKYGNFYSATDIEQSTKDEETRRRNYTPVTQKWDKLHKNVRSTLVINFCYDVAGKYKLSKEQINDLKFLIKSGIYYKYINSSTIKIEDNVIISIKGLQYDKTQNKFYLDMNVLADVIKNIKKNDSKSASKQKPNANQFLEKWGKYIDFFDKYKDDILKEDNVDMLDGDFCSNGFYEIGNYEINEETENNEDLSEENCESD